MHAGVSVALVAAQTAGGLRAHAVYLVAAIPLVIAVVVSIIVWRSARKERAAVSLRTALASDDPSARRSALDALGADAIGPNAPLLCELVERERDPDVLDALAAAVARSRWEPTDDPALLELRRFVAGGTARATRSSAREPTPVGARAAGQPAADELADLVPKVNALLDGRLEHLELVSIDGEVLTSWTADRPAAEGSGGQSPK